MVSVNVMHPIYLCKALINQLTNRPKKTAIIMTSSTSSLIPLPGLVTYTCTKTFVSFLAQGLFLEMGDKVDVLDWKPCLVDTKLLKTEA